MAMRSIQQLMVGLLVILGTFSVNAADLTGFTEEFVPFNFMQSGEHKGLANDILTRIAANSGLQIARRSLPWLRAMEANDVMSNSVLYTTVRTADRESKYLWVGPYDECDVWLIKLKSRRDLHISTKEEAKKYRVGAPYGAAGGSILLRAGFPSTHLDLSSNEEQNVRKLYAERFEFSVGMLISHYAMARKNNLDPSQLEPAFILEKGLGCYFAFNRKVDPKVFQRFSAAFTELSRSGELKKLRTPYFK